jgi:hypothetical protein
MMEFWTKVAAFAQIGQVIVLILTAVFVWKYLQETAALRRTAQEQVGLANEQLEAQIRPALTVTVDLAGSLCVSNIGSGTALNLRLVRTKVETVDWEAKSNFGAPAMGAAVAVGQLVGMGSAPGSIGNLRGENLHLIYESLSGKGYASIVTFNGIGQPSGVRILAKEKFAGVTYPALGTTREA